MLSQLHGLHWYQECTKSFIIKSGDCCQKCRGMCGICNDNRAVSTAAALKLMCWICTAVVLQSNGSFKQTSSPGLRHGLIVSPAKCRCRYVVDTSHVNGYVMLLSQRHNQLSKLPCKIILLIGSAILARVFLLDTGLSRALTISRFVEYGTGLCMTRVAVVVCSC